MRPRRTQTPPPWSPTALSLACLLAAAVAAAGAQVPGAPGGRHLRPGGSLALSLAVGWPAWRHRAGARERGALAARVDAQTAALPGANAALARARETPEARVGSATSSTA